MCFPLKLHKLALFEEALLGFEAQAPNVGWNMKVAAAIQNVIQCYRGIYDKKKRATTQTLLDCSFKKVDRIESSKESEPAPSTSGLSESSASLPSAIAEGPSTLPSPPFLSLLQSVTLLVLLAAPVCQRSLCTTILYKALYCKIKVCSLFLLDL